MTPNEELQKKYDKRNERCGLCHLLINCDDEDDFCCECTPNERYMFAKIMRLEKVVNKLSMIALKTPLEEANHLLD